MPTDAPRWAPPLLALQLLSRLPLPMLARLDPTQASAAMPRAMAWLPLAGTLVGAFTAIVFVAGCRLWPPPVAAGVALALEAWLTGAFHEDAVADFCDAFGGRAEGEEARRIMKDSRIGSYGALGLLLLVGLRWASIAGLPLALAAPTIVAAGAIGRLWAVALLRLAPAGAGDGGLAGAIGRPPPSSLPTAVLLSLPGVVVLGTMRPWTLVAIAIASAAALPWLARGIRTRLGGSTGDCLGFAAYAGQVLVGLAVLAR